MFNTLLDSVFFGCFCFTSFSSSSVVLRISVGVINYSNAISVVSVTIFQIIEFTVCVVYLSDLFAVTCVLLVSFLFGHGVFLVVYS